MKKLNIKLDFKKIVKTTYAPTIISLIIFFTNYKFFGLSNVIIAPYMALTFIRMKTYVNIEKNPIKSLFIHLFVGLLACIASFGWIHSLIIDFFGTILLTYLLTDEYNPSSYFPYLMGFVFLQLFPTSPHEIPIRLLAIFYSYCVVFIGLKIFAPKMMTSKIRLLIRSGYENISLQLKLLEEENFTEASENQFKLFEIGKELNRLIYSSGKNKYYPFVIFFQHMNNILSDLGDLRYLTVENKKYLRHASRLFHSINKHCIDKNQMHIIEEIEGFLSKNKFKDKDIECYFKFILRYFTVAITDVYEERKFSIKSYFDFKETREYFKEVNRYKFSLNEFKLRFSIRMGVLLGSTFAFVRWSNLPKSYWIPMTVFLLTLPFYEDSKTRVKQRFTGTIIGIIISSILFSVFKTVEAHIIIIIISTFFMYAFVDYGIMTIYITCYALAISTLTIGSNEAILLRILYTGASLLIVLFANRFILRTKNHIELKNMIGRLIELDEKMIALLKNTLEKGHYPEELRKLLFSSYLISGKLQMHNNPNSTNAEDNLLREFIFKNNKLTTLIAHECIILANEKEEDIDLEYTKECINALEDVVDEMHRLNTKQEYNCKRACKNVSIIDHTKNYTNIQLLNCLNKGVDSFLALEALHKIL